MSEGLNIEYTIKIDNIFKYLFNKYFFSCIYKHKLTN
jgi:hypothetical protein